MMWPRPRNRSKGPRMSTFVTTGQKFTPLPAFSVRTYFFNSSLKALASLFSMVCNFPSLRITGFVFSSSSKCWQSSSSDSHDFFLPRRRASLEYTASSLSQACAAPAPDSVSCGRFFLMFFSISSSSQYRESAFTNPARSFCHSSGFSSSISAPKRLRSEIGGDSGSLDAVCKECRSHSPGPSLGLARKGLYLAATLAAETARPVEQSAGSRPRWPRMALSR
mmetsp:Transcript_78666/g.141921  ORF Transcript_78666/g.141921 Transcript_78666/m.141921 type:complete len:222 (-) Transcript_78666:1065-1730(-)